MDEDLRPILVLSGLLVPCGVQQPRPLHHHIVSEEAHLRSGMGTEFGRMGQRYIGIEEEGDCVGGREGKGLSPDALTLEKGPLSLLLRNCCQVNEPFSSGGQK